MITAVRTPEAITIRGHAGYAAPGQDIVCAAVSILTETLAAGLPTSSVQLGPGYAKLHDPGPQGDFVWQGLCLLAHRYPENIRLVKNCPENGKKIVGFAP